VAKAVKGSEIFREPRLLLDSVQGLSDFHALIPFTPWEYEVASYCFGMFFKNASCGIVVTVQGLRFEPVFFAGHPQRDLIGEGAKS
jgi:hypothetical protein